MIAQARFVFANKRNYHAISTIIFLIYSLYNLMCEHFFWTIKVGWILEVTTIMVEFTQKVYGPYTVSELIVYIY